MSTAAPPKPGPIAPPDEQFWDKYSPHYEFPLSSIGSLAIHVLVLLGLLGLLLLMLKTFQTDTKPVPITAVISLDGEGDRSDSGGSGGTEEEEDVNPVANPSKPTQPIPPADLSKIDPLKEWLPVVPSADVGTRPEDLKAAQQLAKMNEELRKALIEGMKGKKAGTGPEEGTGNTGNPGVGSGNSDATSSANRSLRWVLDFGKLNGKDYLAALAAMKANLMFPQPADWKVFKRYNDLSSPKGEPFSIHEIQGSVYFVDDVPESASKVARALGLDFDPPLFIAVVPKETTEEMARKEREYRNRKESEIFSTEFKVLIRDGKPTISVTDQKTVTGRGK